MAATVTMTHWPELGPLQLKERLTLLESKLHATAIRPIVRYPMLGAAMGKMPNYLRRAALNAAIGAVSSFLSNYSNWFDGSIGGKERQIGARPPRMGFSNVFPSLYGGNMLLVGQGQGLRTVLLGGTNNMDLCPTLMQHGAKVWLSCPVALGGVLRPPKYITNKAFVDGTHRVCSIDVGINTAATAAIVDSSGTVIARTFLTCGRHNDRRDALGAVIAGRQQLSGTVRRGERHCLGLHRRIAGLSLDAARGLASSIAAFAAKHGAKVFVIEDLKGWRPKGPSRAMKKRFHRFQHRALVQCLSLKEQELGLRVLQIHARGTSRWAYDGSGVVKRSKGNAQLATFSSGKQYNADLNGALNIAARGLAMLLGIKPGEEMNKSKADAGKSPGPVVRMPLVLADIWAHAQISARDL